MGVTTSTGAEPVEPFFFMGADAARLVGTDSARLMGAKAARLWVASVSSACPVTPVARGLMGLRDQAHIGEKLSYLILW